MPSNNPIDFPIAPPNIGSQYVMYFAEATDDTQIIDFNTVPAMQLFSNTTGLTIDVTKLDAEYYSVPTPIKFNGSTVIAGEQSTFATPNSVAYITAKTTNNYTTNPLESGLLILTGLESFTINITRVSTVITKLEFVINTLPITTTFVVPVATGATITEIITLINTTAPLLGNAPVMVARQWVGDGSTVFNILPNISNQFIFNEKVALVDTHVLTSTELEKYPKTITIVYPKRESNLPKFFNVLLYNTLNPELSFQFYGIRNKGFTLTFANNGLTTFTYPQLGKGAVSQPNLTTIATPYFIDDYEKMYTQATYNTAPFWDGVYAGQLTDASINLEYDIPDQLNISGVRFSYPNGKHSVGVSGGAILNDTSYSQFFTDMVNNRLPSFVLESNQLINGLSYQMLSIQNFINGKPSTVTLNPGALQFPFPADAIGQLDKNADLSNMFVFLHDEIPNFETNI